MRPLNKLLRVHDHIIPQVIKSKFIVRTISYITAIHFFTFGGVHVISYYSDRDSVEFEYFTHPLGIPQREVIINSNKVNTFPGKGIQVHWKGRHEGFTFTCRHLGYLSLVQNDTANKLYVVRDHIPLDLGSGCQPLFTAKPPAGVFYYRESLR